MSEANSDTIKRMVQDVIELVNGCGPQIVVYPPWMIDALGIEKEKDNMDGVKLFETED